MDSTVQSVVAGLKVQQQDTNKNFFDRQVLSRIEAIGAAALELVSAVWEAVSFLIKALGVVGHYAIHGLNKIFKSQHLQNLENKLPNLDDWINTAKRAGQLFLGCLSSLVVGITAGAHYNYKLHQKVGVVA